MTTIKTRILEAYAKSEYGDGPAWAKVTLTPERIRQLTNLSNLCLEHQLCSVTVLEAPDEWDMEDEIRLVGDETVVSGSSVWFTCYPKHADYECETRITDIATLIKALAGESDGESIIEGDIVFQNETVKETYTEYLADQTQGETE